MGYLGYLFIFLRMDLQILYALILTIWQNDTDLNAKFAGIKSTMY